MSIVPAGLIKAAMIRDLRKRCKGRLLLTYDDGPGRRLTPPLVEFLRRYDARASFFLVGFRAADLPEMCELLRDGGHELGCHTQMHKPSWRVLPWTAFVM